MGIYHSWPHCKLTDMIARYRKEISQTPDGMMKTQLVMTMREMMIELERRRKYGDTLIR